MKRAMYFARLLSAAFLLGTLTLWGLGLLQLIYSRYRSDVASISIGHHFFYVACDNGLFDVGDSSPDLTNSPWFWWSAGLPYAPKMTEYEGGKLIGFNIRSMIESNLQFDPNDPNLPTRHFSWQRFSCGYEFGEELYRKGELDMDFGGAFRGEFNFNVTDRRGADGSIPARYYFISVPVWFVPVSLASPPALWLLAVGRRQLRRRSMARRGLCTNCGYDLRGTPTMCPECGTGANIARRKAGEWRVAFYGVFAVLIAIAVFLNRLNPVQECKPSTDDRRPAQLGMAIPWNPDAEHPDPAMAALADNGPYTIRLSGGDLKTIDVLRDGKLLYQWKAYSFPAWIIYHDVLYREKVAVVTDNNASDFYVKKQTIIAIDLRDGHQLWESGLVNAPYPHDDPNLCFGIRDGRLVTWADDNSGRFAEVKELQTGKSIGYCFYERK